MGKNREAFIAAAAGFIVTSIFQLTYAPGAETARHHILDNFGFMAVKTHGTASKHMPLSENSERYMGSTSQNRIAHHV